MRHQASAALSHPLPRRLDRRAVSTIATLLVLTTILAQPVKADDRELFRSAASNPYVFMMLDTSGSMHFQKDGGFAVASQDDPSSRLYQAKSALYQVVRNLDPGIRMGWAHFNQENLDVFSKHWVYTLRSGQDQPSWWQYVQYPQVGAPDYFGSSTGPLNGLNPQTVTACNGATGSNGNLASTINELQYYAKLGYDGGSTTTIWYANGGDRYRFTFDLDNGNFGDALIRVKVRFRRYSSCGGNANKDYTDNLVFERYQSVDEDGVPFRNAAGPLANDFMARHDSGMIPGGRRLIDSIYDLDNPTVCNATTAWTANDNGSTGNIPFGAESDLGHTIYTQPAGRYAAMATCTAADGALDRGNMIPWDWVRYPAGNPPLAGFELSDQDEILCRLAPNTCVNDPSEYHVITAADKTAGLYPEFEVGDRAPDFRVGRYFQSVPVGGRLPLKALYADRPPVAAISATPLAGMMNALAGWANDWENCAEDSVGGDRSLACRERFAILLSDGEETCNGDVGAAADALRARGIRTFVIGFGAGVTAAQLADIADRGGTGTLDLGVYGEAGDGETDCTQYSSDTFNLCPGPILAADKQQLVFALESIFSKIESRKASFASAAVPAGQADAQDSIFLTNFVPLDSQVPWPGEMVHYIRPLPLRPVNGVQVPDDTRRCNATRRSECLAWKANESMLGIGTGTFNQVPDPSLATTIGPADDSDLKLGMGPSERRVFFGLGRGRLDDSVGYTPPLFKVPTDPDLRNLLLSDSGLLDLNALTGTVGGTLGGLLGGVDEGLAAVAATIDSALDGFKITLRRTFAEKNAEDPLASGETIRYVLGDIFHSDPQQLGDPGNLDYLTGNLPEGSTNDCDDLASTSYKCFFLRHQFRRKVVFAGSNDGQMHAFDAGRFQSQVVKSRQVGEFDLGSGQELFSFIPNSMLSHVNQLTSAQDHEYGVDGELRIDDVFIDPSHNGTPTADDRLWRTVLLGSLREGGETAELLGSLNAYYALDVTQPDRLKKEPNAPIAEGGVWVPDTTTYVPSCLTSYTVADCGPVRYGSVLWEFSDIDRVTGLPLDEDVGGTGVGASDLASTWSRPTIGRVRVEKSNGTQEDRYVAIFGGGLDKDDSRRGNWLYILDVETGKVLAKRQLEGAAPSGPAAVDTDGDALIDTIYIGTVAGNLYKLDLSDPGVIDNTGRVRLADWTPLKVFVAGPQWPMYTPPSVIFVPRKDRYAVSFGVGNRSDLWDPATATVRGRFYTLLDTGWKQAPGFVPFNENDFEKIAATDTTDRDSILLNPPPGKEPGWILTLDEGEKLLGRPFTLAGVTVFSTYVPEPFEVSAGGRVACERRGYTNIFTVFTSSGNALISDRFRVVPGIVSNPFTEVSALQGRGGFGQTGDPDDPDNPPDSGPTDNELTDDLIAIREAITELFPDGCRFNNVTVNLKVVRSDTGIEFIAPVPICIQPSNWKDL